MAIMAKDSGGRDFKPIPAGAHLAICTMVADVGMQEGFSGKPQRKVYLRFEVPDERVEFERDGQKIEGPAIIGKMYTLSLSEKANLRRDLENWRGRQLTGEELKGFDISKLIGKPCQIMVTHDAKDGKIYANLTGIMGVSKDQKPRAATLRAESETVEYSVEDHQQAAFERLPKWIQEKIQNRIQEHPEVRPATIAGGDFTDDDLSDIPF
ncbi:MAG: hypothetical protein IT178_16445 [Acidobacteria bacterium]|nr:hypothetical protein [Acidobacteriota bacterium]